MQKKRLSREERKKALQERTSTNINNVEGSNFSNYALNFKGEEITFYKPKKGRIKIDIIPYIIETKNDPSKMKPGLENYVLEYHVHYGIGPEEAAYLCLKKTFNKPCPICEELQTLKSNGAAKEEMDALKPKQRCLYNIIDKNNIEAGIQLFEVSYFLFEKELREEAQSDGDGNYVTFADLEDGKTIQCRASDANMGGRAFVEFKSFSFIDRKPYSEDILDESYSLDKFLFIPTYEQVRDAFLGIVSNDDEESESPFKDEEEAPRKSKKVVSKTKEAVDEDDEDEEEEAPVPPKKVNETPKSVKNSQKCPSGGVFGKDCDTLDECEECKLWEKCADAQEELEG